MGCSVGWPLRRGRVGASGRHVGHGGWIAQWMRLLWTGDSLEVVAATERELGNVTRVLGRSEGQLPGLVRRPIKRSVHPPIIMVDVDEDIDYNTYFLQTDYPNGLHQIIHPILVGQNSQCLAVLDDVTVYLVQGLVLELEPFLNQLRRRQAHSRLLQELLVVVGAALFS